MTVIDGEVWEPELIRWDCPTCTNRIDAHPGDMTSSITCAADPRTGRRHPPVAMVRVWSERQPSRPARAALEPSRRPGARRVLSQDELEAMLRAGRA